MESNEQTAIRLLTELVSLQNGAPLDRHKEEYDKLMNEIYSFLDSHSPTEPTEIIEMEYRDYSERALKPEFKNHVNACNYCDNNKSGAEQGYWCATNCISGSKFASTETTLEELKLM